MEKGDLILIVSSSESTAKESLGGIEGKIIDLSEKGIQIEWQVQWNKYYRAWIPKSLVYLIEKSKFKQKNQYTIALPKWAKLDVTERPDF